MAEDAPTTMPFVGIDPGLANCAIAYVNLDSGFVFLHNTRAVPQGTLARDLPKAVMDTLIEKEPFAEMFQLSSVIGVEEPLKYCGQSKTSTITLSLWQIVTTFACHDTMKGKLIWVPPIQTTAKEYFHVLKKAKDRAEKKKLAVKLARWIILVLSKEPEQNRLRLAALEKGKADDMADALLVALVAAKRSGIKHPALEYVFENQHLA